MRRVAWLLAVGCYHPNAAANNPCNDQLQCPDGQSCDTSQEPPTCIVGDAAVPSDVLLPDGVFILPDAEIDAAPIGCSSANPCPSNEPICDTGTCRGCAHDAECPDDVCIERSGLCVAAADAIYLDPAGVPGMCTQAAPCATIADGLPQVTATRNTIRLAAGTYTGNVVVPAGELTISGPGTGTLPIIMGGNGLNADAVTVKTGSTLLVETSQIQGGRDGLAVDGGTATAFRITFANNAQHPVRAGRTAAGSVVHVEDSVLPGGQREGVHASTAAVADVQRCTITGNQNGGLWIETGSQLAIADSFIVSNGSASSMQGGVNVTDTATVVQFSFNTVANNQVLVSAGPAAGVACATPCKIDDAIVADDTNSDGSHSALGPMVTATYSLFGGGMLPPGTGNLVGDPMFLSATDFHISGASPARGAGDPAATDPLDVDGQPRPQPAGTTRDIGADEVP